MYRRAFLGAATAFVVTSPLAAQTAGPAPAPGGATQAETQHLADTMRVGSLALAASRIAAQKASEAGVKQFANFEVAEQETIAEVLKSLQGANVTTGQGKAPNAEIQGHLDDKGKAALKKLQDAKAGPEFDKEYVQGQIEGHKELLSIQERYIRSGKMREQVNIAKLARGQIKEHIELLQNLSSRKG